jgi:hypothetical protein
MICLNKLLLIVDGLSEEGALRSRFNMIYQNCPEIRHGPGNGIDYNEIGYAEGVLPTLIKGLSFNARAIILIPDLEKRSKRNISYENFSKNIKTECIKKLVSKTKFKKDHLEKTIFVCPPDIMFENWIVSDIHALSLSCELFDSEVEQEDFDGRNGAAILKRNMNCKYKKSVHARKLFNRTDFNNSRANSRSFSNFIDKFEELVRCYCT